MLFAEACNAEITSSLDEQVEGVVITKTRFKFRAFGVNASKYLVSLYFEYLSLNLVWLKIFSATLVPPIKEERC